MNLPKNPKLAIAGCVNSSLLTFKSLIKHELDVKVVLALNPEKSKRVSGYQDLKIEADSQNIPSLYFNNINESEVINALKKHEIDIFFVVGLSQIVKKEVLDIPKYFNIGFHPTKLPQGRGRGAVAWMILGKTEGAATFFMMDEGMDSGPILGQKEFEVSSTDYASDVIEKIKNSISIVLDEVLPQLKKGIIKPIRQDESEVTFLGQRKPKDGLINWNIKASVIYDLIRATSEPLPGAFFNFNNNLYKVFRSHVHLNYCGVAGRVIDIKNGNPIVACREGAIELVVYDNFEFKIGTDII